MKQGIDKTFEEIDLQNSGHGCYSLCFVYSPKGNFLIKGRFHDVTEYLNKEFPICFYNRVQFKYHKKKNSFWYANGILLKRFRRYYKPRPRPNRPLGLGLGLKQRKGWEFVVLLDTHTDSSLYFRRLPRRWVQSLTNLINVKEELLVASDLCEGHGLIQAAKILRNWSKLEPPPLRISCGTAHD